MRFLTSSLSVFLRSRLFSHSFRCFSRNRSCMYNSFVNWTSSGRRLKGIMVTGASAATCAVIYLTLTPNSHDNVQKHFKICYNKIHNVLEWFESFEADSEESGDVDLFFSVGYVDDWLTFPFFSTVSDTEKVYESSAFVKPNIVELLSPWEQSSSDDPWVLLQLTKSGNFWVRQMGVACLANKVDWEAYKYRNVAQACDYRTVIGLARYAQSNDAYFRPQPKLVPSETDVFTVIQNLVNKMPTPDKVNPDIAFYRDRALQKEVLFQKDPLGMDFLTHFYTLPWEEERKVDQGLHYCLQALDAYTSESSFAHLFVCLHGLAALQRLHEERKEKWIQSYVLIILNNLAQWPDMAKHFVQSGWISELRKWSKGRKTTYAVMADTVLANLDRDWISSDFYNNMILLHPTQRNSLPVNADIVLVHGLKGGAVKTWRQRNYSQGKDFHPVEQSDCWPKDWLSTEFQDTRIISVGYRSSLHQWEDQCLGETDRHTLQGQSEELIQHLMKAGVGNRPVIWLGHSRGGLLIKQILSLSEKNPTFKRLLDNTKGIIMYSVPHRGSHMVDAMMYAKYVVFPSIEVQEMSTYSDKLQDLHDHFVRLVSSYFIPCLSFGESVKTEFGGPFPSVLLVSQDSSDPGIGQFYSLPTNHIDVCKPVDKEDPIYEHTHHFLAALLKNLKMVAQEGMEGTQ